MVIPHLPKKGVRSLKFPVWAVSIFVILNFVMFTAVCVFCMSYHSISTKLENKKAEYMILEKANENNEKQLNEYKANEQEIKDKMKILMDLESKLKSIIQSKGGSSQSNNSGMPKLASRGMANVSRRLLQETQIDSLDDIQDMYTEVDDLKNQVDSSITDLNDAIEKAESRAKALRAIPSILPTYGEISSTFGSRKRGREYEFHKGVDIANSRGTPIRASGDGVVVYSGWESGYGYLVRINHGNGYESLYGHNSKIAVKVGQSVKRGQIISYMGSTGDSTGPHCHFEIRLNGVAVDPLQVK